MTLQNKTRILKTKSFWAFALGTVIGGTAIAGFHGNLPVTLAWAQSTPAASNTVANISPQNMQMLQALDQSVSTIVQNSEPAVVNIQVEGPQSADPQFQGMNPYGQGQGELKGEGSGVIFRPDGYIITNDHVVDGMTKVMVVLNDGRKLPGKVIRSDESGDIAVVKINATNLPTLDFANSDQVHAGQMAMAVGSPLGLSNSVTIGHISALDRSQIIPDQRLNGGRYYPDMLQTDAAINPGNSGGALVNIYGQVIGINTAIESQSGGSQGIGFAIPSNQARLIAEMLISTGTVTRAFIGVDPEPLTAYQAQTMGIAGGALLNQVSNSGPAEAAGLRKGDVVTQIGDLPIKTYMDLRDAMLKFQAGQNLKVTYVRNGKTMTSTVKLGEPPKLPTQPQQQQQQYQRMPNMPTFPDFPNMPNFPNMPRNSSPAPHDHSGPVRLGTEVGPLSSAVRSQFHIPANVQGVVVASVQGGSVADSFGLQPGDVIEELDGKTVTSPQGLMDAEKGLKWGDQGSIKFQRWDGQNNVTTQSETFTFN